MGGDSYSGLGIQFSKSQEAGEVVAQWLLSGGLSVSASTHMVTHNCSSSSRASDALFCAQWAHNVHVDEIDTLKKNTLSSGGRPGPALPLTWTPDEGIFEVYWKHRVQELL